jgi:hypothetical protein
MDDHGEIVDEEFNEDGSGTITYADGTVETWYADGSGSIAYADGATETWDGQGGGTFDDGHGNSCSWNADGSGEWSSDDGSFGTFNADGSGSYTNADGSYGSWNADGSGEHTDPDGTTWVMNSDGSGSVTYPDGTVETWEAGEAPYGGDGADPSEGEPSESGEVHGTTPPDPNGYVNEFILPLFEGGSDPAEWGLDYDEDGPSSWTLPIDMSDVDLGSSTFVISGDMVGEWEGGIPPEAVGPDADGNYTIQSWPIAEVIDNGDGTVTLVFDIEEMP